MRLLIDDSNALPEDSGAYLLLIDLAEPVPLPERFAGKFLLEGRYGYAGSARGPGGIRARCRRHLSRHAKRHWHVDWLTRPASDIQVIARPGDFECSLINSLAGQPFVGFPLKGFGSTNCRRCPAHLVRFDRYDRWDDLTAAIDSAR